MPLTLDESLSVGVGELDDQHREIVARPRMLGEVLGSDERRAAAEALGTLVDCVALQFAIEERYMRQESYPHLPAHARVHRLGVDALERAVRAFEEGGASLRFQELQERSARWLDVHLRAEDLRLGMFTGAERWRTLG